MEITSLVRTRIASDPIATMAPDQIRKADVEAFLLRQAAAGRAHSSGRMTLWALRSAFSEAFQNELIDRNPADRVQLPTMAARVDTVPFTLEEARRLTAIREWEGVAIRTLLFCGLRIGELAALRNGDVVGVELTVDESTDGGGRYKTTKSKRVRYVPVPPQLLADLLVHRTGEPDAPLFPDPADGEMWDRTDALNERLRLCAAAVGVQGFTSRRCRTTCGTLLEADIADVRDHLGHTDTAMTMKHYRRSDCRMSFIVIIGQIVGGADRPFKTVWSSDMEEKRTPRAAISHGFKTRGSDDFRVGDVRAGRLVAVSWMDQKQFDVEEVYDTADQLGMAAGPVKPGRKRRAG